MFRQLFQHPGAPCWSAHFFARLRCPGPGSYCLSEAQRSRGGHPPEDACEMALIGETAFGRDGGQGPVRIS